MQAALDTARHCLSIEQDQEEPEDMGWVPKTTAPGVQLQRPVAEVLEQQHSSQADVRTEQPNLTMEARPAVQIRISPVLRKGVSWDQEQRSMELDQGSQHSSHEDEKDEAEQWLEGRELSGTLLSIIKVVISYLQ
jgi:hypothetical protein